MMDSALLAVLKREKEKIAHYIENKHLDGNLDLGVLAGIGGEILFSLAIDSLNEEVLLDKIKDSIVEGYRRIRQGYNLPTYCAGLAGFGWVLGKLVKEGYLDRDQIESFRPIDSYLSKCLILELDKGNLDFLHGGIGILYYFFNSPFGLNTKLLNTAFEIIKTKSIQVPTSNALYWTFLNLKREIHLPNLSLSHGISAVLIVLSKYKEHGIMEKESYEVVTQTVNYLLSKRTNGGVFPGWVFNDQKENVQSRLAWCYGNLGVGIALIKLGEVFANDAWLETGKQIVSETTLRRNIEKESICDASLCHGSSGLAAIYKYFGDKYGLDECLEASNYWLNVSLKITCHENAVAGYKYWLSSRREWQKNDSLLEGSLGYGLSLAYLANETSSQWLEAMLIY